MKDNPQATTRLNLFENLSARQEELLGIMRTACQKIAPLWPLENFVAVNPFLGLTHKKFDQVATELASVGGVQMTMPSSFYLQKFKEGSLDPTDLGEVLQKKGVGEDPREYIKNLEEKLSMEEEAPTLASLADIATRVTGKDWNRFRIGRISSWAASYFDKGQAAWLAADQGESLFKAWKLEASIDRTPQFNGLKKFRQYVKALPEHPIAATQYALEQLELAREGLPLYLHRLLLGMGGWAAYAAWLDWESKLYGRQDGKLIEFLAVLVCWEACLKESLHSPSLSSKWQKARLVFEGLNPEKDLHPHLVPRLILQEAWDRSKQRQLAQKFQRKAKEGGKREKQVKAQAIFCIDVRSEVFRRNLEWADEQIETLGFAGFFAFPIRYLPLGHGEGEAQCPVLLQTGPSLKEHLPDQEENQLALQQRLRHRQFQKLWKSFKSGAVSCFSFVSPLGLSYLPKLLTDALGRSRPVPDPHTVGLKRRFSEKREVDLSPDPQDPTLGISLEQQVELAQNALTAMSLKHDFAPFVLIVGHGATMVNNPHASGYDCGACGGHSGEANARVAAAVLNNPRVRKALGEAGFSIPSTTLFLACLHDTTTDQLSILNKDVVPADRAGELQDLQDSLARAGQASRKERALKLQAPSSSSDLEKALLHRSKDWAQIRPEWGLAGCSAFVVAPRERTRHLDLEGQSFLHSYDWRQDQGFSVLELIMTAPMVVTSWINLQYYGSTVDNKNLGAGNKTLHNVTAGLGVLEGYSGDLRVGLPLQSIHDGKQFQHEPLRLQVIIEAPREAMNAILQKHPSVRDLCDNGWIFLMAMNEEGKVSHRYSGNLAWEEIGEKAA